MNNNIENLPVDVQRQLLLGMSYSDIINTCMTNQHFQNVVCNDIFWSQMIMRDFGIAPGGIPAIAPGVTIQNLYHIMNRLQGIPLGRADINTILLVMGFPA